jgi:5-methylcytosine-specific restriction endonuclease McrA
MIGALILVQFGHMFDNWNHKRKLETDPKYKLLDETKYYMNCFTKYEPDIWLDSIGKGELIFYDYDITNSKEKIKYQGTLENGFIKKLIEAKSIAGYELKRCRECGSLDFDLKYPSSWNGFCKNKKCKSHCTERDLRHLERTYNGKNEARHLFDLRWEELGQKCKICYDMIKYKEKYISKEEILQKQNIKCAICKGKIVFGEDNIIPIYEYAEKQNFLCAICNGKMNHIWNEHMYRGEKNYLYHTIDHIIPISKGGKHHKDNVQIVHFICNIIKGVGKNIKLAKYAEIFIEENKLLLNNEDLLIEEYKKNIRPV